MVFNLKKLNFKTYFIQLYLGIYIKNENGFGKVTSETIQEEIRNLRSDSVIK